MHRESNLKIFQLDATYSVYYITVGSSTFRVSTPETCGAAYSNV